MSIFNLNNGSIINHYFKILFLIFCTNYAFGQGIGTWTWVKNSGSNGTGFYGVQGIPNALNEPPSRYAPLYWTDQSNNLWLFGGGNLNDLWKYDIATNQWTFVNGSATSGTMSLGTKGVPSPTNQPGGTWLTHPSWIDNNGDLWLYYKVLWRYSIATNQWTWISGNNGPATFGTPGVASAFNSPSNTAFVECRGAWVDANNNFWLYDAMRSDMWFFNTSNLMWTFKKGTMGGSSLGSLGTLNVPSASNIPESDFCYSNWTDTNGDFYIYLPQSNNVFNIVWKYDKVTNMWVWIDGQLSNSAVSSGYCNSQFPNFPATTLEYRTIPNAACPNTYWVYGGFINHLWLYNVVSKNWTWVKGPGTSNPGTIGVPNNANFPASVFGSSLWSDNNNNLWMLGNLDNRLWKYQPDSACLAVACSLPDSIVYLSGCAGNSFTLANGSVATSSGTYVVNVLVNGVLKSIYYYVTLSPPLTYTFVHNLCGNQGIWLSNGSFVTNPGSYFDTLTNQLGCDSINKHIIYKNQIISSFFHSICDNQPILLPSGISTFTPGVYLDTLTNVSGCDSIIQNIISANIGATTYVTVTDTICNNAAFLLYGGQSVTTPGVYYDTSTNASGCPQINTYNIFTIPFLQTNNVYLCNGSTYTLPDNTTVSAAGAYFTYSYFGQCFTTMVTFINPINSFNVDVYDTICANGVYTTPLGHVVNTTGIYRDTFQTIYACDSIITTHLEVLPTYNYSQTIRTCTGQMAMLPSGIFTNVAGLYHDSLTTAAGCDSIIHSTVIFDTPLVIHQYKNICVGEYYTLPSGNQVNLPGIYLDTLMGQTIHVCDTFFYTHLFVKPTSATSLAFSICANETYILPNGQAINTPTIFYDTLLNVYGCDSVVQYTISIKPISSKTIAAAVCKGNSYLLPGGQMVYAAGTYVDTLTNYIGCDSLITTYLTLLPTYDVNTNDTFCTSQTYTLPTGIMVNKPGNYTYTLSTSLGCDSTIHLQLEQINQITFNLPTDTSLCIGTQITLAPQNIQSNTVSYWWSNQSTNSFITIDKEGIYTLSITEPPCNPITKTIQVHELDCDCKLAMPNAFTPNNDGINGIFMPINVCDLAPTDYQFMIYNRWGEVLFNTKTWNTGWNGYYKGALMEVGTYLYTVQFKNPTSQRIEMIKGNFALIK